MKTRVIAAAAGLLALVQLAATPAATSAPAGQPATAPAAGPMADTGSRVVTLPTGQQVALYGPPGAPTSFGPLPGVSWPADDPVTGVTMDGHLYAIPASVLPTLAGHLEDYDLTRLAGGPAAPATHAVAARRAAADGAGSHNFWTLTINPVPVSGAITFYALVQLLNVDDAAKFAITTGHEPPGPVTSEIDVHHLQGAASVPVTSATLRVSFDGGQTWQQADLTPAGPGQYQASYVNPAGPATADLWLTAADAQGNTLSQVIHQAYAITAP